MFGLHLNNNVQEILFRINILKLTGMSIHHCSNKSSFSQHFEYNSMKEIWLGSAPVLCFDVRHGKVIPQNCTKETNSSQHWDVQEVSSGSAMGERQLMVTVGD